MATLFTFFISAFFLIFSKGNALDNGLLNFPLIQAIGGGIFFLGFLFFNLLTLPAIRSAEQSISPYLGVLFHKEKRTKYANTIFSSFIILSLFPKVPFFLWILFLGVSIDLFIYLSRHLQRLTNPFLVLPLITKKAIISIQENNNEMLCNLIDTINDCASQAIERKNTSLANLCTDELKNIAIHYFNALTLRKNPEDQYILFYLLQRIESMNFSASRKMMDLTCSKIISSLGKMILKAPPYDTSTASLLIYSLGSLASQSVANGLINIGTHATFTLAEVSKEITEKPNIAQADLKTPILAIIAQIEMILKEVLRQERHAKIKVLTEPLEDIKRLFNEKPLKDHPDSKEILKDVERALANFDTIEMVKKAMPKITEEESLEEK